MVISDECIVTTLDELLDIILVLMIELVISDGGKVTALNELLDIGSFCRNGSGGN